MKELESRVVEVTDEIIAKTKILRYKEVVGGFQRKLNTSRVGQIVEIVKKDARTAIPPILLAHHSGGHFILVDGQHRFEARKRVNFPLFAQIVKMDEDEAAKAFVVGYATGQG